MVGFMSTSLREISQPMGVTDVCGGICMTWTSTIQFIWGTQIHLCKIMWNNV